MNEELFQLLDGDLPDDATAELLHRLSVDPDKRAVFRQQMKLQGALYRNEGQDGLTPTEEAEMFDRLGTAVGVRQGSSHTASGLRPGLVGIVYACLMLGMGTGYLINEWTGPPEQTSPPAIIVEQPEPAAPPVLSINRDSLIIALRDSVAQAYTDSVAAAAKVVTATPKKATTRKRPSRSGTDDLTGAPEAKLKKKKK
jgi:hypothetical protein